MNKLQAGLLLFIILFVLVFLTDYILIKRKYLKRLNGKNKKKRKLKNNEMTELSYLIGKFKLNKNELNLNKLLLIISLINALIISIVAVVVLMINIHFIFQLVIGFILLIALIYSIYELLGRYLSKERE